MNAAFEGRTRRRLYREPRKGMIFGVCAGIADYFGFNLTAMRAVVVVGALISFPLVLTVYLVMALLLKRDPRPQRASGSDDIERRARTEPHTTLSSLRYRFHDMDRRLQRLEQYVTSKRYELDREFERLRD